MKTIDLSTKTLYSQRVASVYESLGVRGYFLTRLATGLLLIVAGATKVLPYRELAVVSWLIIPAWISFGLGAMEFALGCYVLTFRPSGVLWGCTLFAFLSFLAVLLMGLLSGEVVCACLGSMSFPIVVMLVVDALLFLSTWLSRRSWLKECDVRSGFIRDIVNNTWIVAVLSLLVGLFSFGSIESAIGFMRGHPILVDSSKKHAGTVAVGESADIAFHLTNSTSNPLSLLGAKSSCNCIGIVDLPTVVPPHGSRDIRLSIRGRYPGKLQRETADLIFEDSAISLVLTATVVVRPNL